MCKRVLLPKDSNGSNCEKDLAVKAIRLPRGNISTMDSPYLSLISLVKAWPQQNVRREVLMVTDGIDRLRGEKPEPSRLGPRFGPVYHSMPTRNLAAGQFQAAPGQLSEDAWQSILRGLPSGA